MRAGMELLEENFHLCLNNYLFTYLYVRICEFIRVIYRAGTYRGQKRPLDSLKMDFRQS